LKALAAHDKLVSRAQTAAMYAVFLYNVDTTNQQSAGMQSKAIGMYGQVGSAVSFMQPEILAIGKRKIDKWIRENKKLKPSPLLRDAPGHSSTPWPMPMPMSPRSRHSTCCQGHPLIWP
jgi:oligoendopeptidase F